MPKLIEVTDADKEAFLKVLRQLAGLRSYRIDIQRAIHERAHWMPDNVLGKLLTAAKSHDLIMAKDRQWYIRSNVNELIKQMKGPLL